jgi:twitching motility protein PilT
LILEKIILKGIELKASDIHLVAFSSPVYRIEGDLVEIKEFEILDNEVLKKIVLELTNEKKVNLLDQVNEIDFSIKKYNVRMRGHIFKESNRIGITIRIFLIKIPKLEEMEFPSKVFEVLTSETGLFLICGATGSGKTTTLAAMIDYINRKESKRIITLEDPIEYIYKSEKSLITQREIGVDTKSFLTGLKSGMREDPDIILLGEMRDYESIEGALLASETGHLVLTTIHSNSTAEAIDRIVNSFPYEKQQRIRVTLAETLKGIIAQKLIKNRKGKRELITEILLTNSALKNLIVTGKTSQIKSILETNISNGMHTMESSMEKMKKREVNKINS